MRKASITTVTAVLLLTLASAGGAAAEDSAAASASPVAAHAAPPTDSRADPAEKINRVGYAIHQVFDRFLIRPAAMTFKTVVPKPLRLGIENVLNNLGEPVVVANDLLQGRPRKAGTSSLRFVTNSTIGIGGLFDIAKHAGLPRHDNDFALTLGRAGIRPGPYLFIPLLGPTTVRDAIGRGVDAVTNPFHWLAQDQSTTLVIAQAVVSGLDARANADADLRALMSDATDPYATLRSVYLQNQQSQIDDTGGTTVPALPDFDDDSAAPPAPLAAAPKPTG